MKKISFEVEGQKLHGTLFYPEKLKSKNPAILFLHGWRSSERSSLGSAEALSKIGFICMTFTMRGHNGSEGDITKLTREDFLADIKTAYDYLIKKEEVDQEQINVIGSSFGSYMVSLLSKERKVKNLALRVPANYPDENWDRPQIDFSGDNNSEVLYWRFKSLKNKETYAVAALHTFEGNVLIIESEKDQLIPHETIENYLRTVPDHSKLTYIIMKGADHAIHNKEQREKYTQILTDWFKDKM